MRKTIAAGVTLLIVALLLAFSLRGTISVRVMERALEHSMARDVLAELPDGLHVILCGAGAPLPDTERSGPCVAVLAGRNLVVVDAGSHGARTLQHLGITPGRIEALFLTHFHSDHIDGLGELALLRWTTGSHTSPLPVVGPTGVRRVVEGFNAAYALDFGYRTAHHGPEVAPPAGAGSEAVPFRALPPGEANVVWERDGLRVTAFAVSHAPAAPAVGYRFDYGGRSAVISGDTRKSDNLQSFATGADLLVHEALAPRLVAIVNGAAHRAERDNVARIAEDILAYHTTPVQAAEIAAGAGVGHLLYYHILPPLPLPGLEAAFLEGVDTAYRGPVTLGRDGTVVSLPRDNDRIDASEWL